MAKDSWAAVLVAVIVGAGVVHGQAVDTAAALGALRDANAACRADGGRLWGGGRSLCGPIVLMDRGSRLVLATDTVPGRAFLPYGGAFAAVAPADAPLANTSFRWGERSWALVLLPLPRNRFDRVRLLLHESFHREQAALGLAPGDRLSPHLDERDGRLWLRMELRALAAALEATGAAAGPYVEDAVAFRAQRYALFPGADTLEAALELHEGLAEYTGTVLALGLMGEEGVTTSVASRSASERARESGPTCARSPTRPGPRSACCSTALPQLQPGATPCGPSAASRGSSGGRSGLRQDDRSRATSSAAGRATGSRPSGGKRLSGRRNARSGSPLIARGSSTVRSSSSRSRAWARRSTPTSSSPWARRARCTRRARSPRPGGVSWFNVVGRSSRRISHGSRSLRPPGHPRERQSRETGGRWSSRPAGSCDRLRRAPAATR